MDGIDSANIDLEKTLQKEIHDLAEKQFFLGDELEDNYDEEYFCSINKKNTAENSKSISCILTPDHWLALSTGLAGINKKNPYVFLAKANYHIQKGESYGNFHSAYKNTEKALKIDAKNYVFRLNSVYLQESIIGWNYLTAPETTDFMGKIDEIVAFSASEKKLALAYNTYVALALWFLCDSSFDKGNTPEFKKLIKYQSLARENLVKHNPQDTANILCLIDCYTILDDFESKISAIRQFELSLEKYSNNTRFNRKLLRRIKNEPAGHKVRLNIPYSESIGIIN